MANINIIITDAGIAEIVNAENNGTAPVILSEVGYGTGQYTPSASQTALKGEFKRLDAISGGGAGDNVLHITAKDDSNDAYSVYEIGIYTESGTLFAVCSQTTPIISKAAVASALIAFDIVLSNINPSSVTVGDTNFLLNQATTEKQGIIELATEAEAKAGTDTHRAVTPKALDATIEAHDNIVHRSGAETISGSKTFTKDITVNAPATSAPTGVKINDTNGKGTGYLAQYYAGNEYYTRVMCKNNTSGKYAHIDVKINDDGTSMFSPSVDVMCAPSVSESDKSAKVATTEWVSNKVAKYLPLTGGTISGTIFTSGSGSPVLSVKKGDLNGGRIFLFAPNDADFLGGIVLRAYNSDNTRFVDLTIKSDNTMTWGGKNIVRSVNNINANAAGNVTISISNISGLQSALDGKAAASHTHNYLSLSGGTVTGAIRHKLDAPIIASTVSTEQTVIAGGTSYNDGAYIILFGKEHDSQHAGGFVVRAKDNAEEISLYGYTNGVLEWDGKNIVRSVNNINANAAGNVTISISNISGLQDALNGKAASDHTHSYLPLSGGQMTSTTAISRNVANSFLGLHGGTGTNNDGAQLFLCGASHSTMPGSFQLNARNSEKVVSLHGNLDGTLLWDEKYVLNNSFQMPTDGGAIMLTAGTSATGGAYFRLYGKDHASGKGQFNIVATDGTNTKALAGKPDDSLTWGGKDVMCVDSIGTNYIRFTNGVQICWENVSVQNGVRTFTLPKPFIDTNYVLTTSSVTDNDGDYMTSVIESKTSSTFNAEFRGYIDAGYIAIGKWK